MADSKTDNKQDNLKNINAVPMDRFACGRYRILYPAMNMYNVSKMTISNPGTFRYYGQEWIFTQRICGEKTLKSLLDFKKQYGVKFCIDYDDIVWKALPDYNKCAINWEDNRKGMELYLNEVADKVTCTNEFLKKDLTQFVDESKIIVMPNCLDYNRWRFDYYKPDDKITFFYAGSPTHYTKGDTGDFGKGLVHYLSNKELNIQGIKPDFLRVKEVYPWVDIDDYPIAFANNALKSKFVIAPLVDNYFNKCKSDLKYIESCAVGRVCLVSDFPDCPYSAVAHEYQKIPLNSTATAINYIVERANEHYDEIIEHQYKVLNERWLKRDKYLELFS